MTQRFALLVPALSGSVTPVEAAWLAEHDSNEERFAMGLFPLPLSGVHGRSEHGDRPFFEN